MEPVRFDQEVRVAIARFIRERAGIPQIADVARMLRRDAAAVEASFARMIEGHVFIPKAGSREIYAYDPFCVGPTDFHVRAEGRDWWGICGWDALGIPPALGTTGTLTSHCADRCGESIAIDIELAGSASAPGGVILHVGVPARSFWEDIYFT